MKIVFCGQLTNAFTRAVIQHYEPERRELPNEGGYYGSLYRYTDPSVFDRAATLATISDESVLACIDWGIPGDEASGFGVSVVWHEDREEWAALSKAADLLVAALLDGEAFSQDSLMMLERGGSERYFQPAEDQKRGFAEQQLREILFAVVQAGSPGVLLAVTDAEERVLNEVSAFIKEQKILLPFDFPDMETLAFADNEGLPPALLNYSPSDPGQIPVVRADPFVRRYSAAVKNSLAEEDAVGRKRALVRAMREAVAEEGRIANTQTVIEIFTGFVRAIQVPVAGLVLGGVGWFLKEERGKRSWHLLRSRMSEVSARDYIARNGNL